MRALRRAVPLVLVLLACASSLGVGGGDFDQDCSAKSRACWAACDGQRDTCFEQANACDPARASCDSGAQKDNCRDSYRSCTGSCGSDWKNCAGGRGFFGCSPPGFVGNVS